jgi:hypothetical protein
MNLFHRTVAELRIVARLLPPGAFARWARGFLLAAPDMFRQRSLGPVDRLFGEDFTFCWKGREIRIERSDMGIVREIFGHRCYVSHTDISTARNILDLGCNSGLFTAFALLEAPEACIQAVDAQRDLLQSVRSNIARLDSSRVTIECAFVGEMHTDWALSLREHDPEIGEFDVRGYLEAVGHCDFMKCDVEGGEFSFFRGDLSWTEAIGAMAIEVHPEYGDVGELASSLRRAGFRVEKERHSTLGYLFCGRV